jgi:hypothetical protein
MRTVLIAAALLCIGSSESTSKQIQPPLWPYQPDDLLARLNAAVGKQGRKAPAKGRWNYAAYLQRVLSNLGYRYAKHPKTGNYVLVGKPAVNWIAKKPKDYEGRYQAVFMDDERRDRLAGRGGSGKKVRSWFSIRKKKSGFEITYGVELANTRPGHGAATAKLSGVELSGNQFRANPVAIKTAWPLYLPTDFEGRFVQKNSLIVAGRIYKRK